MLSSFDSPAPAIVVIVLALALATLFVRDLSPLKTHRFVAIDGLRGFLSPFVFLHHAAIWFYFSHNQGWAGPVARLYANSGGTSVALFFMITSFLFCSKLIESRAHAIDWLRLYVSRILRLTPLYWCVVAVMFSIVAFETRFRPMVPPQDLWAAVVRWGLFTVNGPLEINGYPGSQLILAGVTWTLPYEWYFYLLLPLLGLAIGARSVVGQSAIWLIVSVITACSFSSWGLGVEGMYPFVGGAVAAAVVHMPKLREQLTVRGADVLALLCIWLAYVALPPGGGLVSLLLLTTGFTLIACGVDIFGLLKWRAVQRLSSLSYGIYLWHGVVLFVVMRYIVGRDRAATLSLSQHWLVVFACAPLVVGAAALSFRWIERPAMDSVPALTRWLRRLAPAEAVSAGAPDGGDTAQSS